AARWKELGTIYPTVGLSDEAMVIFLAEGLSEAQAAPDPGELVSRLVVPLADLPRALDGTADAKTLVALAWLGVRPFAGA
ncbi:MAG: hypothetical protein RLZZ127_3296, partial [Planctomycetota bacterium]